MINPLRLNPLGLNFLRLGAIGPCAAMAPAAERHGFFRKHGIDVRMMPVPVTEIPTLSEKNPVAHIGAPAALMRASCGDDIRIIACFDSGRCSGCLVVAPGIVAPRQLRTRRLGARVKGAAMWIQTVLALRALGLDPSQDEIDIVEIGDPDAIVAELQAGRIDGAVVSRAHAQQLTRLGFSVLLDLAPRRLFGAPDALVATTAFLRNRTSEAKAIVAALVEAAAFLQSSAHRASALECIAAEQNVSDPDAAEAGLREFHSRIVRRPYPSLARISAIWAMIGLAVPRLRQIPRPDIIDDGVVRALDDTGFIEMAYGTVAAGRVPAPRHDYAADL